MDSAKECFMLFVVMVLVFMHGAEAQVHHVVGEDRGWDVGSDIALWADGRTFTVGDFVWFAYSGGNVVELGSKEEYESCDVSNPIKMYTDGVEKITLEQEGTRYFASSITENCKKGLKLPVEVIKPKSTAVKSLPSSSKKAALFAQGPVAPSSSTKICGSIMMVLGAILFTHFGL